MSRPARIKPQESGGESELSDFTSDLLDNLKGEFKLNLKRSTSQPARENRLSLSLLAEAMQSTDGNSSTNAISDEIFIFNHIVNCTKSLMEVINRLSFGSIKDTKKSLFYSGLMDHITKMVKAAMLFPATEATLSTSTVPLTTTATTQRNTKPFVDIYQNDFDRLFLTSHSLMTFPSMASNSSLLSSHKAPLLHFTVFNSHNFNLVKAVYYSCPSAIKTPDKDGALPLHWAALGSNTQIVQFLLEKYPPAAGMADSAGYIPLHWAVNQDRPCADVYKLLINAYPQGVSLKSPIDGTLPLHWCVNRSNPDISVVKELAVAYAAGIRTPCRDGWLPLHYCLNHSKISYEILSFLLDEYPNAVTHKNCDGQLPVHRLLDRDNCSIKALQMLLKVSNECLLVPDNEGYLPLHIALDGSNPPSWRLVKLLLQYGPEAIKVKTKNDFLPLHIAMKMNDNHGGGSGGDQPNTSTVKCDEPLSDDEFSEATIAKLNANRYLSIVHELTSEYPEAVHDVAIDIIPTEPHVEDLFTYTGGWKKSRWTPMSRAISKGKNSPIALLLRPFQKQRKPPPTMKEAGDKVIAANRLGGPLVSIVTNNKLNPIAKKSDKTPRRPPPRTKKPDATASDTNTDHEAIIDANKNQVSVKKKQEKEQNQEEVERLKQQHEDAKEQIERERMAKRIQSASRLKAARRKREQLRLQKANAADTNCNSTLSEAEQMAAENSQLKRIYTAEMKAAGFFEDVTIIDDDENALKFNKDDSAKGLFGL